MTEDIKVKRLELVRKRMDLQIDELEVRKMDLQLEFENVDNQVTRIRKQILDKDKEIEILKMGGK